MIKVRAHTCYLGKSGYSAHSRSFFRELSKYVDLRIRNYTWDENISEYLNDIDKNILDCITLNDNGNEIVFPISNPFPNINWTHPNDYKDFNQEIDIVLMESDHHYFYDTYNTNIKIAYTVWESTELEADFFNQLLKFDYLWVVTKWHKEMIIKQGYPENKVFIVNEGVNSEFFNLENFKESNLPEINGETFNFLFFGRWDYRKAVPECIKAFIDAFPNNENVNLILSADNPYSIDGMNSTEERLKHYGLIDDRIKIKHFLSRNDYISYMKMGNCFISCARSEGWNIPLIEALASGIPATYSNWGAQLEFANGKGLPIDIIKECPASYGDVCTYNNIIPGNYIEPNFIHLKEQLQEVYNNYKFHKEAAINNAKIIQENFNWENIGKKGYDVLTYSINDKNNIQKDNFTDYTEIIEDDTIKDNLPNNECCVVMSHAISKLEEETLFKCIKSLKDFGYFVILSSHIQVKKYITDLCDFFIIDKDNPIIYLKETKFIDYVMYSWHKSTNYNYNFPYTFNHGLAAIKLINNGLVISNSLNYKNTHLINYDYILLNKDLLNNHTKKLEEVDLYSYKWVTEDADGLNTDGLNTGFFSVNTNKIVNALSNIKTKEDYFNTIQKSGNPSNLIAECFMYSLMKNNNINILIDDDIKIKVLPSELMQNTIELSIKNSLFYNNNNINNMSLLPLVESETGEKFIFIENKDDCEYDINIKTLEYNSVIKINNDETIIIKITEEDINNELQFYVENYEEAKIILVNNDSMFGTCEIKNRDLIKDLDIFLPMREKKELLPIEIFHNFNNGPYVEIKSEGSYDFNIKFIDTTNNNIIYKSDINSNMWTRNNINYYIDWNIVILNKTTGKITEIKQDLKNKKVLITIDSSSLGDNLAWLPAVDLFQKKHDAEVYVSTFHNNLFDKQYPNLNFIEPGTQIDKLYTIYNIGWYYDNNNNINNLNNKRDFKTIPLQQTAFDILGLDNLSPVKPKLNIDNLLNNNLNNRPIKEDYVCFGIHATAQTKYWNNRTGWQELTDYFISKGKKVVIISNEEDGYMGNKYPKGAIQLNTNRSIFETMQYLKHCEMFVGVGSGLSWLSWAMNIKTVIISGFSYPYSEPIDDNIIRIYKESDCNGCFNSERLDAGDWNWCPYKKGTKDQFMCSDIISSDDVISTIETNPYYNSDLYKLLYESYSLGTAQNFNEILNFAKFIKESKIKDFIEIGTDAGGTFNILGRLTDFDGLKISIDLEYGQFGQIGVNYKKRNEYLKTIGSNVHLISGDSHDELTKNKLIDILQDKKVDLLFIDGDHTYNGVKKDFEMYKEFVNKGGYIVFHDINKGNLIADSKCEVYKFWESLEYNNKIEFKNDRRNFFGIGIIKV